MVETQERKEGWQSRCALDPHAKENAIKEESIEIEEPCLKKEYSKHGSAWKSCLCLRSKKGSNEKCRPILSMTIGNLIIIIILIISIIVLSATLGRFEIWPAPAPLLPCDLCPNSWIGFQRKCYYFSEAEGNWTSSSLHCSSHNASLAVIDSQEEMDFLLRYKAFSDHWIGLQRDSGQSWRWVNGSIYKGWLRMDGGRRCAYLTHGIIASSSCTREVHWICSKEMAKVIVQIVDANP